MSRKPMNRSAAWLQISVGVAVVAWWAIAAATDGIVELQEGRIDIVFHIAAELLMAWLLIAAGTSLLRRGRTPATRTMSALALGTLLYSSINSPGFFAEQGAWWAVAMFAAIAAAAAVTAASLVKGDIRAKADQHRATTVTTGYGRTMTTHTLDTHEHGSSG
jgi:hypothetical protein